MPARCSQGVRHQLDPERRSTQIVKALVCPVVFRLKLVLASVTPDQFPHQIRTKKGALAVVAASKLQSKRDEHMKLKYQGCCMGYDHFLGRITRLIDNVCQQCHFLTGFIRFGVGVLAGGLMLLAGRECWP